MKGDIEKLRNGKPTKFKPAKPNRQYVALGWRQKNVKLREVTEPVEDLFETEVNPDTADTANPGGEVLCNDQLLFKKSTEIAQFVFRYKVSCFGGCKRLRGKERVDKKY